jgi:hypothetical protein
MASSRIAGPLGRHPEFLWHTAGPIGYHDAGDPDVDRIHTTDTAGPLGYKDWGDPEHPAYRARNRRVALNWSGKTSKPPTGEEMKNNPSVRSYLLTMLKASYDAEGKAEGEHGGWIYSSPEFPETFCFKLTTLRFPRAVDLSNPPDLSHAGLWVVGTFHTHPHRDEPGRPSRPWGQRNRARGKRGGGCGGSATVRRARPGDRLFRRDLRPWTDFSPS